MKRNATRVIPPKVDQEGFDSYARSLIDDYENNGFHVVVSLVGIKQAWWTVRIYAPGDLNRAIVTRKSLFRNSAVHNTWLPMSLVRHRYTGGAA